MSPEDATLGHYIGEVKGWVALKLTTGRCSALLVRELAGHFIGRTLEVFRIYDEIGHLEGAPKSRPTSTKPAARFKRAPLRGLWHKHYTSSRSIVKNLINHWTDEKLETLASGVSQPRPDDLDALAGFISHRLVIDGYRDRSEAQQLTGEWIVFAKQDGRNYYLTLGTHTEAEDAIVARCAAALAEFPEVACWKP